MAENDKTKAPAVELNEAELDKVQGGGKGGDRDSGKGDHNVIVHDAPAESVIVHERR